MNKKLFIGATALTTVAVAGAVYYRHVIVDKLLERLYPQGQEPQEAGRGAEALRQLYNTMTDEDARQFEEALKQEGWKTGTQVKAEHPTE